MVKLFWWCGWDENKQAKRTFAAERVAEFVTFTRTSFNSSDQTIVKCSTTEDVAKKYP